MQETKKQYLLLLSEIISQMVIVFGPDVSIFRAQSVDGLVVSDKGIVTDIKDPMVDNVEEIINVYMKLSGPVVKSIIDSVFAKYPPIKRAN